ncbi:unnamed protein product [Peronospora destructor]|uniref:Uncharacterized protein n=1 Tax=Peronospora destructor TaxID=86335 RepID=A0AAV0VDR6_9STRA|nr:unnamed protein product [Peronospora destructor]
MLHLIRPLASQHQLFTRLITTSRPLFVTLQAAKAPLTSLNKAAAQADLNLNGTLEEIAARHFSEPSIFPELTPMEDTLLSQTLTLEMQQHFCEPSDFPEYTVAEEEIMLQTHN